MNTYMNKVTLEMFSYFDTGNELSEAEPERFYHGFVLGLMVELVDQYIVTSNRESGFGLPEERIRKYGFAFCGKKVLIGDGRNFDH